MINGIGSTGKGRVAPTRNDAARGANVIDTPAKAAAADVAAKTQTPASALASLGAPIDSAKIAQVRAAIAEGRYPVDPDAIAEKMIALDLPLKF